VIQADVVRQHDLPIITANDPLAPRQLDQHASHYSIVAAGYSKHPDRLVLEPGWCRQRHSSQ
jgi:hypothetical protein